LYAEMNRKAPYPHQIFLVLHGRLSKASGIALFPGRSFLHFMMGSSPGMMYNQYHSRFISLPLPLPPLRRPSHDSTTTL
jgi:hypothetical protein